MQNKNKGICLSVWLNESQLEKIEVLAKAKEMTKAEVVHLLIDEKILNKKDVRRN